MKYQSILKYLQITNKPVDFPITIVEECGEFSKVLNGAYVYFDNEDANNVFDSIMDLGTTEAHHCAQLFTQTPENAYRMILMRSGWNSFTDYFINQYGSVDAIFVHLNKGETDSLVKEQQNIFSNSRDAGNDDCNGCGDNYDNDDSCENEEALAQEESVSTLDHEELNVDLNVEPNAENTKMEELKDFIDSMIVERSIQEEEQESTKEQERIIQKKKELHGELNYLLKANSIHSTSLNLGVSARDLAKWKEKNEKFRKEVNKVHPRQSTSKEKPDNEEYPSGQNNSPPELYNEQKEFYNKQKEITEEQKVTEKKSEVEEKTEENFTRESELFSQEDVFSRESANLEIPRLIGNLTELVTTSEENLKKAVAEDFKSVAENFKEVTEEFKDTQLELQKEFLEELKDTQLEFKGDFKSDLQKGFNRFQENLEEKFNRFQQDSSVAKDILKSNQTLLEKLTNSHSSEKLTELLQQNTQTVRRKGNGFYATLRRYNIDFLQFF